jgi:hypothetical protein
MKLKNLVSKRKRTISLELDLSGSTGSIMEGKRVSERPKTKAILA